MFSTWDLVRPTFWYPMSSLEQSMMELEHMSDLMMRSRFPFDMDSEMLAAPSSIDDDDFFSDLPVLAREQKPKTLQREAQDGDTEMEAAATPDNDRNKKTKAIPKPKATPKPKPVDKPKTVKKSSSSPAEVSGDTDNKKQSDDKNQYRRAFSSYSFSDSSIVDDKGRRITSTRRRYEDSTGRLKAMHERQIEGKKLRTTWNRLSKDDEGNHESVCSSGTPEEFEALWQQTPFGEAQKKTIKQKQEEQQQQALEDAPMEE